MPLPSAKRSTTYVDTFACLPAAGAAPPACNKENGLTDLPTRRFWPRAATQQKLPLQERLPAAASWAARVDALARDDFRRLPELPQLLCNLCRVELLLYAPDATAPTQPGLVLAHHFRPQNSSPGAPDQLTFIVDDLGFRASAVPLLAVAPQLGRPRFAWPAPEELTNARGSLLQLVALWRGEPALRLRLRLGEALRKRGGGPDLTATAQTAAQAAQAGQTAVAPGAQPTLQQVARQSLPAPAPPRGPAPRPFAARRPLPPAGAHPPMRQVSSLYQRYDGRGDTLP